MWENTAYAIPETCLALTIFRDQLNPSVVGLFTTLLFCKIFHWLADARVEHIEQSQVGNTAFDLLPFVVTNTS